MMASISTFAYKPANLIGTWEVKGEDTYPYIITFTIKEGGWGLYHFYNQYNNGYNQYNNGYNRPPYPSSQNAPSFGTWLTLSILCAVFLNKILFIK